MYTNLNIEHLGYSSHEILVHEFDLTNQDSNVKKNCELINEVITRLDSLFKIEYFLIFYLDKDKEWINNDLSKYNLLDSEDDLFNKKDSFINNGNTVYFFKKYLKNYWIPNLSKVVYDRLNLKIWETIFIHLSKDIIIYPHDDYWFWIIDLWNNQDSIGKIKKILEEYWAIFFYTWWKKF